MSELDYPDFCIITRNTGALDSNDNPESEEIYRGACDFQPGGQTAGSIITHNDTVYLPRAVMVLADDGIEVTSAFGRRRSGVVKLARELDLDITGDCSTEIEIKQSVER